MPTGGGELEFKMTATLFLRFLGLMTSLGFGYLVLDYNGPTAEVAHAASGCIRIDGRPLATGAIRFMPSAVTRSVGAAAEVVDGAYAIPEGDGLIPGKYQVRISGVGLADSIRANKADGSVRARPEEPLPARFNLESRLFVEVAEDGNILGFDFDLK